MCMCACMRECVRVPTNFWGQICAQKWTNFEKSKQNFPLRMFLFVKALENI